MTPYSEHIRINREVLRAVNDLTGIIHCLIETQDDLYWYHYENGLSTAYNVWLHNARIHVKNRMQLPKVQLDGFVEGVKAFNRIKDKVIDRVKSGRRLFSNRPPNDQYHDAMDNPYLLVPFDEHFIHPQGKLKSYDL